MTLSPCFAIVWCTLDCPIYYASLLNCQFHTVCMLCGYAKTLSGLTRSVQDYAVLLNPNYADYITSKPGSFQLYVQASSSFFSREE